MLKFSVQEARSGVFVDWVLFRDARMIGRLAMRTV